MGRFWQQFSIFFELSLKKRYILSIIQYHKKSWVMPDITSFSTRFKLCEAQYILLFFVFSQSVSWHHCKHLTWLWHLDIWYLPMTALFLQSFSQFPPLVHLLFDLPPLETPKDLCLISQGKPHESLKLLHILRPGIIGLFYWHPELYPLLWKKLSRLYTTQYFKFHRLS